MRRLAYVLVDVFTHRPLTGNQLAVYLDGRSLDSTEMQAIAREMRLSETTFVLPREPSVEKREGVQVRIFTVSEELPFAGHPTLGTAWVWRALGKTGDEVTLDLKVGKIPVSFRQGEGRLFGEMRQIDPVFGATHAAADIAPLAGLTPEDIAPDLPIETVSTGNAFIIVPLRSLAATRRLQLDLERARIYCERSDGKFFYFVTRETESPQARLHARMPFYGGEDPATGSAAGPCAAWMLRHGLTRSSESVVIEQGLEMLRPSELHVRASLRDGASLTCTSADTSWRLGGGSSASRTRAGYETQSRRFAVYPLLLRQGLVVVVTGARHVVSNELHRPRGPTQALDRIDARGERNLFRIGVHDHVERHRRRGPRHRQVAQRPRSTVGERVRCLGPRGQPDVVSGAYLHPILAEPQGALSLQHINRLLEATMEVEREGGLARRDLEIRATQRAAARFGPEPASRVGYSALSLLDWRNLIDVDDVRMTAARHRDLHVSLP
jgi:trans-2,3-dihydro-3-hydroxyanthranilate isomerase